MKKRVAAVLLSMVMVMSFMPTMAFATSESQDTPVQKETVTETPETEAGSADNAKEEKTPSEPEEEKAKTSSEEPEAVVKEQTAGDEDVSVSSDPPAEAVCRIGETYYNSLNDAKDAVATSTVKTITMVKDTVLNGLVVFGVSQSCTLDLNGYTISREGGWNSIYLDNNASLTVTDSSDNHNGKIFHKGQPTDSTIAAAIYAKGPLTINGGTIECTYGYAVETDWNGSAEINKGAVIKGAANKSIGVGDHWNRSYKFKINGGRFSDNVGNGNIYTRFGNMKLAKAGAGEDDLYGLQLPAPTNLRWDSIYPDNATYEWDHKDLEEYLAGYHVHAIWTNGTQTDNVGGPSYYQHKSFQSFMNGHGEGKYSFYVYAVPTDESSFVTSETVTSAPVDFYKVDLKVNTGGYVLFVRDGGEERIDFNRTWVYPEGYKFKFKAQPNIGYTFSKFLKNGQPAQGDEVSFTLSENMVIEAQFAKGSDTSTVTVNFGSHGDLASAVNTAIATYSGGTGHKWPYDMYGPMTASVSGSVLTITFPRSGAKEVDAYSYVSDVLMEYLEERAHEQGKKPWVDGTEALIGYRAVGINVIGGETGYHSEDDIEKEWEAAEDKQLGETLGLNVLWAKKATEGKFIVEEPVCGTVIDKEQHGDGEHGFIYYTQTNTPSVTSTGDSHFETYEEMSPVSSAANWFTKKNIPPDAVRLEDYWYVGSIEGNKPYVAGFPVLPKFGYYADETTITSVSFTVNGGNANFINNRRMPLVVADVPATHDWLFTGFTWTGSDEAGYTATADYMCRQCAKRESKNAKVTPATGPSKSYTAVIEEDASLDGQHHSETKGDAKNVTVTFFADSEGTAVLEQYQVQVGNIIGLPSKLPPAHDNATFAGWSKEPGKTAYAKKNNTVYDYVVEASKTSATADIKLYPIYVPDRLQVKLVPGKNVTLPKGSDGKEQALEFITDLNEKIRMEAMNAATRPGYELNGWYTANGVKWKESWGMAPEYCDRNSDGSLKKTFNSDRRFNYYTMTLTANWKPGETPAVVEYTLGAHSRGTAPSDDSVAYGSLLTLPGVQEPEPGYHFSAWQEEKTEEHKKFGAGETLKPDTWEDLATNGTVKFTAIFEKNPVMGVIFDTDGGSYVPMVTVTGTSERVYAPENPTKTGHSFVKWVFVNDEGEEGADVSFPLTVNSLVRVKAKWTPKQCRISFDTHGGNKIDPIVAEYGTDISDKWPADPVKANYRFAGWSAGPFTTMPPDDMVIDALWDTTETTITLDANGGKFSDTSTKKKITDIYGAKIYAETPTRNGYTFVGWKDADGKDIPEYMPENDATYIAQWIEGENANTLLLKATAKGKKSLKLSWTNVAVADGYDVFLGRCKKHGKKYVTKYVGSVDAGQELTFTAQKLKRGRNYKAYVKAWVMRDGVKQYITTSPTVHAIAGGSNALFTNPKRVGVKKTNVTLSVGKTSKIKASVIKLRKGKRLISKSHAPKLRYLSTNTAVATVTSKGKIKAVGSGTCTVYVYAANGVWKAVKVTVN